jgi:hypothetical protein
VRKIKRQNRRARIRRAQKSELIDFQSSMRRTRVNTWSICKKFSLLFITKDGPFPRYVFTPVVLLERLFVTEEDEDEVVAEGEPKVRVSSLFVFSLKTLLPSSCVREKRSALWCQRAAAALRTFSNFIRERERERENVGGGGEENDINEH